MLNHRQNLQFKIHTTTLVNGSGQTVTQQKILSE